MGMEADDKVIAEMMSDASQPIDFNSFALMMAYKTMELEPEIILLEVNYNNLRFLFKFSINRH